MKTQSIRETLLDGRTKGIPGTVTPFPLSEIAAQGWNVLREDMTFPLMLLKRANLDHNAKVFNEYLESYGLSLAPHGKTTMAPQLYEEQLANGAWGITAANVSQIQVMRHYDVKRIILGNQLIGKANVLSVAGMINADPAFELYVFTDSAEQLENMARHLDGVTLDHPIRLLFEVGIEGGRTGVRSKAQADALTAAMAKADPSKFRFAGVAGFEGVVPGLAESNQPILDYAQRMVDIAAALPPHLLDGLEEFILSGGGSSFFDLMADRFLTLKLPVPVRVVLRSGCYITTDSGSYKSSQDEAQADPHRSWKGELKPAMEVWSYVQSTPEPDLALLTMGKRDAPYDAGLPVPFRLYRPGVGFLDIGEVTIFAMNDQHAFVRLGERADWQVGDLIASGISHPCTAFDKWRFIPVVDDDYNVIDGVMTFF